jgi:hypothetical protein
MVATYTSPDFEAIHARQIDLNRFETWHFCGFAQYDGGIVPGGTWKVDQTAPAVVIPYRVWWVPLWLPMLVTGLLPAWRLTGYVKRRRRRLRGLCMACGYDLRAMVERCPECGTVKPPELASLWQLLA